MTQKSESIRGTHRKFAFAVFVLAAVCYLPSLWNDFSGSDDIPYILDNERVLAGLSWNNALWAFSTLNVANWHPLAWLSHMLDVELFGVAPWGHHLTSLLIHAANSLLVFVALTRFGGNPLRSFAVAALFAVHPIRVESVAWVAERKDLLCAFFYLLGLLAYQTYAVRKGTGRYLAVLGVFALALMSKPMAVTFPFALLLLDVWPLRRLRFGSERIDNDTSGNPWTVVIEKLPFFAMAVASSAITIVAQHQAALVVDLESLTFVERLAHVPVAYVRYIWNTIWPIGLDVYYPHPLNTLPAWQSTLATTALAGVSWIAYRLRKERPAVTLGWCFFLGTLVPVIGIVQVAWQAIADRYLYLPQIGLFVMVAWGIPETADAKVRRWISVATLATVVLLGGITVERLGDWRNPETLYLHSLKRADNAYAHIQLGHEYYRKGQFDNAAVHFRRQIELVPSDPESRIRLGIIEGMRGNNDEAIFLLKTALEIAPKDANAHYNLGAALETKGDIAGAAEEYRKAIEFKPNYTQAKERLAEVIGRTAPR